MWWRTDRQQDWAGQASPEDCYARPVTQVERLFTCVDLDDRPGDSFSVSARHYAVLSNGRHVTLLDDRGWSGSGRIGSQPVDEIERTARMVVGPDAPAPGETQGEMEAIHWAAIERTLRTAGVRTDGANLKRLPHDVKLSDRLLARLG
jgi:hypothetical protein